jgi:DNA mismatch endonuclease (patch repair protein)
MDRISPAHRSWNMSRIRSANTAPELLVRSLLHRLGYRFRTHAKKLPGRPDIVLKKHRAVILVHGCYWHRHVGCELAYTPKSRLNFWMSKFKQNVERDKRTQRALRRDGWRVIVVWECETACYDKLRKRLVRMLSG